MEFNTLVKAQLFPILQKYGFEKADESKNYLKFESDNLVVVICRDERENSNLLYVGKKDSNQYLIDGNIIKRFFISDLEREFKIPERTIEDFVNNLFIFFTEAGYRLLKEESEVLLNIKKFIIQQSENYTSELLLEQGLEVASRAWEAKDYTAFVESIDKIGINKIPKSYQLKYKIAKQKL